MGCAKGDTFLFRARDRLNALPGSFSVVRCTSCDLIRTNPRPTVEAIGSYYPDDYGPYVATRIDTSGQTKKGADLVRFVKPLARWFVRDEALPRLKPGRMLEVGAASGAFLAKMQKRGWEVEGIETSASAAMAANRAGFLVHHGTVGDAPTPSMPPDLIVAWMVLEHLHTPIDDLRRLAEIAAPGAWLVASVPNAASIDFRLFRDRGYALQVPTHLYHYTPATITRLLTSSGWALDRIIHQRSEANLVLSLGYVAEDLGVLPSLTSKLQNYPASSPLLRLSLLPIAQLLGLFGESGRMTIWARKA